MNSNQSLVEEILKYQPDFSERELNVGLDLFELHKFKARDIIIKEGRIAQDLFFATNSITRCYIFDDIGNEKTMWMEPEKMFVTDFESFIKGSPSKNNLQFYQNTDVYLIKRNHLLNLYEKYQDWAIFGIKFMESYHMRILTFVLQMQSNDGTLRKKQ